MPFFSVDNVTPHPHSPKEVSKRVLSFVSKTLKVYETLIGLYNVTMSKVLHLLVIEDTLIHFQLLFSFMRLHSTTSAFC